MSMLCQWYDFPNVKFTKMLSFFSVVEAYGLIYPCPSGEDSSFACLCARKLDFDWLVYCYKAKCTMEWAEEHIRKDVCGLNSKLASTTNTQIESS